MVCLLCNHEARYISLPKMVALIWVENVLPKKGLLADPENDVKKVCLDAVSKIHNSASCPTSIAGTGRLKIFLGPSLNADTKTSISILSCKTSKVAIKAVSMPPAP